MNLSNTGGGGRGDDKGDVVGTVILHSKSYVILISSVLMLYFQTRNNFGCVAETTITTTV